MLLPPMVDLRAKSPRIFDQGHLGSCTSNAVVGVMEYWDPEFRGSRGPPIRGQRPGFPLPI